MKETNAELKLEIERLKHELLGSPPEEDRDEIMDDIQLYKDSIDENIVVLDHQKAKIRSIESELSKRGIPVHKEGIYL
ncbi:uncharacterized protein KQ657_002594 [Scheffersomyces spartinae]|uniref:Uncharacterized protein n=1 Tax=Scheffersomyces spartinae TaxID=45513 RepID=A0A9P7V6E5_9ASCO|nr:uncharacterized protein KQ657_002594 [Scheffersomyces spartinae]KAG7191987.1 hypothetical protein KQ657_002594 [Scheffersomyces spartinae]